MSDMNEQSIRAARGTAREIIRKAVREPAFAARLRAAPEATLRDAGLAPWAAADFLTHDLGFGPDVGGYDMICSVTSLLGWTDTDDDGSRAE